MQNHPKHLPMSKRILICGVSPRLMHTYLPGRNTCELTSQQACVRWLSKNSSNIEHFKNPLRPIDLAKSVHPHFSSATVKAYVSLSKVIYCMSLASCTMVTVNLLKVL